MYVAIDSRKNVIGETMNHDSVPVVIGSPIPSYQRIYWEKLDPPAKRGGASVDS
jgi:hypothetical protein